jgi:hypothetical protein
MSKTQSWLPTREDALAVLMAVWQTRLANAASQSAYGWVAAECTATVASITAFITARDTYHATPTKANRDMKEEARKNAVAAMRKFARERIRFNPKMNTAQREELGIRPSDPVPTPVPTPVKGPESVAETIPHTPGLVKVRYLGPKPYGVERIEIAWAISETPIDSPELLLNRDSFPHNPWEHTFGAEARGKRLYYSLRYITRENASPWSGVEEAVIP